MSETGHVIVDVDETQFSSFGDLLNQIREGCLTLQPQDLFSIHHKERHFDYSS